MQNRSNRQVWWGQHTHTDTFTVLPLSFSRIGGGSAGTRSCRHDQTDHDDQLCQPVLTIVGTDQSRNGLMLERTRFCNLRTNRCRYLSVQPTAWGNKAMSSARTDHDNRPCQLVLTVVRTDRCQNGPMLEWTQISDVLGQQMLVHLIQTENLAVPTTNVSSGTTNRVKIDGAD